MIKTMQPIEQFYDEDQHGEWGRLDRHPTEFAVTQRALAEYLPPAPAQILDVGGGPGRYAIDLTRRGYQVDLMDLAQASLDRAAANAQAVGVRLQGLHHGNAVDLSRFSEATYEVVLLLGPLYHLLDDQARHQALREAYRVLKPAGTIFVAFLTQFSALRFCAERFPQWLADHPDYAARILTTGEHYGEWGFTPAYYCHPYKIEPLLTENGFLARQMIGCEGIVANAGPLINGLSGDAWEWWADLNYRLGKDPSLHGAASHLLYIGQKAVER